MADRSGRISVRGLTYVANGKTVLDVPRLDMTGVGTTVILGPNGAGKSVLLRLLHGILRPSSGAVTFPGFASTPRQAMVFQRPVLLRRSVLGNVRFALASAGRPAAHAAEMLGRADLESRAHQAARTLSGGEQQRLALVRALATDPQILFLDEPTASLDPASTLAIEAMIAEARNQGTKIVQVTHDFAQARRLADDILYCHAGQIRESAPADRFFAGPQSAEADNFLKGNLVP